MYVKRGFAAVIFFLALYAAAPQEVVAQLKQYRTSFAVIPPTVFQENNANAPFIVEEYRGSIFQTSLQGMLQELQVTLAPEDRVQVFPDPMLGLGSYIKIERAPRITINDAGTTTVVRSWQPTIQDLAGEQRLEIAQKDTVVPPLSTALKTGMTIVITRVSEVEITKQEPIAFSVVKKNTQDLERGVVNTVVKGKPGSKEVTYLVKRVNGKEVSRKPIASKVLTQATTEEILVGTGPKLTQVGPHKDLLNAAAKKYNINATALHCLMMKESRGNPRSGEGALYKGLFQYTDGFWLSASAAAGYKGASVYDVEAQIFSTARALVNNQSGRWPPWSQCKGL